MREGGRGKEREQLEGRTKEILSVHLCTQYYPSPSFSLGRGLGKTRRRGGLRTRERDKRMGWAGLFIAVSFTIGTSVRISMIHALIPLFLDELIELVSPPGGEGVPGLQCVRGALEG